MIWLMALPASASGQLSLRPHLSVGASVGRGAIPSRDETYVMNGPTGEAGLELWLGKRNAIAVGGFATVEPPVHSIEGTTIGFVRLGPSVPVRHDANASGFYARWLARDNRSQHAASFASELGLSYMQLNNVMRNPGFPTKRTAGVSGGVSYSTRAFFHVAPTIGLRGYLHETFDGRIYRALAGYFTLESR